MWEFIWFLVLTVAAELLRPKPRDVPPAALGDFTFPTAEDGRSLPIPIGTVLVSGSNIVWYGDLRKQNITRRTGLFGGSTVVGEQFLIGFQAAICQGPVDALVAMRWDDKPIVYSEAVVGDKLQLTFAQQQLFGGNNGEGGIGGVMDFYYGTSTQTANDYLLSVFGEDEIPAYRNVCYAVSRQMYVGTSKYFKAPAWIVRHCPNSLGLIDSRHIIGGRASNPAAALYYLLTDELVGVAMPASQIDIATFITAGNTLYTEGLGVNFLYDSASIAGDLIEDILRHIDGFRYIDPDTGKLGIGLVREDYAVDTLLVVNASNLVSVKIDEPSWSDLVNSLTVEFLDTNFRKRTVQYQNLAAIERRGEIESRTLQYPGFHDGEAVLQLAARLSKRYAYPLKLGEFELNRTAWRLHEGSLFVWTGYPFDSGSRVMRVTESDSGTIESGTIRVTAIEDIFSVDQIAYQSTATGFNDPLAAPLPVAAQSVMEAPAHMIGNTTDRYLVTLAARSSELDAGYLIDTDRGNTTTDWSETADSPIFAAVGDLTAPYDPTRGIDTVGFTVDGPIDLEDLENVTENEFLRGFNLCLIDTELFSWRDITDNGNGSYTVSRVIRGVLDTVPRPHAENARVWFIRSVQLTDNDPLPDDDDVGVRYRPYNGRQVLPAGSATGMVITPRARASRPYPPGNVLVNGVEDPVTIATIDADITWAARNRSDQYDADVMVRQDAASGWTEEGDYHVEFWVASAWRRTEIVAGLAFTYTTDMRTIDYPTDTSEPVEVRLYGRSGGALLSWDYQSVVFEMIYSS